MVKIFWTAGLSLLLSLGPATALSAQESAPADTPAATSSAPKPKKITYGGPGFRFALGGGYTYRLGKEMPSTSYAQREVADKLRHGFNLAADLHYVFASGVGLGINANFVSSNTEGQAYISRFTETQKILYIGPSMLLRADGRKAAFIGEIGCGGLFLTDKIKTGGEYKLIGTTFGGHASLGGELKLSPTTAIGLKVSANIGAIKELKSGSESIELRDKASASSLMVTAFISFRGH